MNIFEITDKTGRSIRLTKKQWKHIAREHSDMSIEEIQQTLIRPQIIRLSKYNDLVRWYYRFNKAEKLYSFVSVKYLNGTGYIITAYFVRNIP